MILTRNTEKFDLPTVLKYSVFIFDFTFCHDKELKLTAYSQKLEYTILEAQNYIL